MPHGYGQRLRKVMDRKTLGGIVLETQQQVTEQEDSTRRDKWHEFYQRFLVRNHEESREERKGGKGSGAERRRRIERSGEERGRRGEERS